MSSAGSANAHGEWWGRRAGDWSSVQEPAALPLYAAALSRLRIGPGTRVLDAGCGAGLFAGMAALRGASVVGIDASAPLVAIARSRFPNARFEVGDVESPRFEDSSFGIVTGLDIFQYAARPSAALAQAARVTRHGGRVLVATWGDEEDCEALACVRAVGAFLLPPDPAAPAALALSNPESVRALAGGAGLIPVERGEVEAPFLYPDLATALRGMLSAGPAARAIEIAGEECIRAAVERALAPYRLHSGGYRLENRFRYVVFRRCKSLTERSI